MSSAFTNASNSFIIVQPNVTGHKVRFDKSFVNAHTARLAASNRDSTRSNRRPRSNHPFRNGNQACKSKSTKRAPDTRSPHDEPATWFSSGLLTQDVIRSDTRNIQVGNRRVEYAPLCGAIGEPADGPNRHSFLLYHNTIISAYTQIIVRSLDRMGRESSAANIALRSMFSRESVFNAFSAMVLSVYEDLQQLRQAYMASNKHNKFSNPPHSTSHRVLAYSAKALQSLRGDINDGKFNDDDTLMAMVALAGMETRLGNWAGRDFHRKAIARLVVKRGGLPNLSEYMRLYLYSQEFRWTLESGKTHFEEFQCMFQPLEVASMSELLPIVPRMPCQIGPYHDRAKLNTLENIPLGFQSLISKGLLSCASAITAVRRINASGPQPWATRGAAANAVYYNGREASIVADDLQSPFTSLVDACVDAFRDNNAAGLEKLPTVNLLATLGLFLYYYAVINDMEFWSTLVIWPLAARIREILTEKLLLSLTAEKRKNHSMSSGVVTSERSFIMWLTYLTVASWVTADKTLASKGRLLTGAASHALLAGQPEMSDESCKASMSIRKSILNDFLWSEKLDFDIVDGSFHVSRSS